MNDQRPESGSTPTSATAPSPALLDRVVSLYDAGLYVQAYRESEREAPLSSWRGAQARVLAGRLASSLEGRRLGEALITRGYRENPQSVHAWYFYLLRLQNRFGPLSAWRFLKRYAVLPENTPADHQADWFTAWASVLSQLRDFTAAGEWLDRAEAVSANNNWVFVQRAYWLEEQDRYVEALEWTGRARALAPWYRPAVLQEADLLRLLGRNEEALALLSEASTRLESPSVTAQLAVLQVELNQHKEAMASLDRYESLALLMEKPYRNWLEGKRSDICYQLGDHARALEYAEKTSHAFFSQLKENLRAAKPEARRVLLSVPFVRQHWMTCAPATLTMLCRYWGRKAEHLEIAEAICYDGTSDHSERHWSEQNGWLTREFTVTWETARALLNRGVPFALTTVNPTSGHLQAVCGFDERRGTLWVRDPNQHTLTEYLGESWLSDYRSTGPRGMLLLPEDEVGRLDGLELPDAALYDGYYRLQRALAAHDRDGAQRELDAMLTMSPEHRLVIQARRTLAIYDGDSAAILECNNQLLAMFPNTSHLLLSKLGCLQQLSRRDEALEFLKTLVERPNAWIVFWQRYAKMLSADVRQADAAIRWLRRTIQRQPQEGAHYHTLAGVLWDVGRFQESLELYRFAACLNQTDEHLAMSYFRATRFFRQTELGLAFLRERCRQAGKRSSDPARTLYDALDVLDRATEALAMLDDTVRQRPDDGAFMLFAAWAHAQHGNPARGQELLEQARGKSPRGEWLQAAARLADRRGDHVESLRLWRALAELEPLNMTAQRRIPQLIAESKGRAETKTYLSRLMERFPHHYEINCLRVQWLRDENPAEYEAAIRHLLTIHPVDVWAHRELAIALNQQNRFAEALAVCDDAIRIMPRDAQNHYIKGTVLEKDGQLIAAAEQYRHAIRLSADAEDAMDGLLGLCESSAERIEALRFVQSELERQVIFGDGLLAFRRCAQSALAPDELLARLREAHTARPDLWQSWSALIQQLIHIERLDEALQTAETATRRFPSLPRLWLDLADAHRARRNTEGEIAAIEQALQINPNWSFAMRRLSEALERQGKLDRERETMEKAVLRDPLDEFNHGYLADALWRAGQKEAALARIQQAIEVSPGYEWAWSRLADWGAQLGQTNLAVDMARALTKHKPGQARSWWMLAKQLESERDPAEFLGALDKVIELNPRHVDACDLRAWKLAELGRYDEALAACNPPAWNNKPPMILRGRAAWVQGQRGNRADAIARMRQLVELDRDYLWGWRRLADWYEADKEDKKYLEATEEMVRLSPRYAVAYGYRGDARLRNGLQSEAKTDFQKAIELDPHYRFAVFNLFDLQLADGELPAAEATLAVTQAWNKPDSSSPDYYVMARQAQLLIRQGAPEKALGMLPDIARAPERDNWPLDAVADALTQAGWQRRTLRVLWRCMDDPRTIATAGQWWAKHAIRSARIKLAWKLLVNLMRQLRGDNRPGVAFLRALSQAGCSRLIWFYVHLNWNGLQSNTRLWGEATYAFVFHSLFRPGARWACTWTQHKGLEPWMLNNAIQCLMARCQYPQAIRLGQHAITVDDRDSENKLWLATALFLHGDVQECATLMKQLETVSWDKRMTALHACLRGALDVESAPPDQRWNVWLDARKRIRIVVGKYKFFYREPQLYRTRRHCLRRMAMRTGGLRAQCGYLYELFDEWLPS